MSDELFKQAQKIVQAIKAIESLDKNSNIDFKLFRNSDEAINAIRNNEVPGIYWSAKDEKRWNEENHLERCNDIVEE